MKISNALAGLALLAVSLTPYAPARAADSLGVDFPAGSTDNSTSIWNLGWSFTANSNVKVCWTGTGREEVRSLTISRSVSGIRAACCWRAST